jgi:glycosyltransferase involved in cell wall biosynthesis
MEKLIRVAHLTSVHRRGDTRVFLKECTSLAKFGFEVFLVVADGKGNELKDNISICDVGLSSGRLKRIFKTTTDVYKKALELNADIYHFHDPELIPVGLKLKKMGKIVIFDSHEDVPSQILSKHYLNQPCKLILSKIFAIYERYACQRFDAIVCATPHIKDKFLKINPNALNISNFPILNELTNTTHWQDKKNEVFYVGELTPARGIKEMIKAMAFVDNGRLNLGGVFPEAAVEQEVKTYPEWSKINALGFLDRAGLVSAMAQSKAGLVTLQPLINYIDALPVKMFEYMAAGLPVIASNFPLWRRIVEDNNCGICVDPLDSKAIAEAISYLIFHPDEAEKMGQNGRKAVLEKYNWGIEEKKLIELYRELMR